MISTNSGIRTNGISARRIIEMTVFVSDEHAGGREPEREAVHDGRGDREQRTQTQHLHERHVIAPESRPLRRCADR